MTGFQSKKAMAKDKLSDLSYDIEQLFIEGYSPKYIAATLACPIETVYDWIEGNGCDAEDEFEDPTDYMNLL